MSNDLTPGSRWRHRNGQTYIIEVLTNVASTNPKYVPTVVYRNITNGTAWSRPAADWSRSMTGVS